MTNGGHGTLLVVAPTRRELGGLAPGQQGNILGAVTGLGRDATVDSLGRLLARHRPAAVVSLGFAGGLSPDARPGDLVLCDRTVATGGTAESATEPEAMLLDMARGIARQAGLPCRLGGLATAPASLLTPQAKAWAGKETGAIAVDMEGYWMVREAQNAGVPCLLLRAILDPVEAVLPKMVQSIVADQGRHEVGHTTRYLLRRPWRIGQVLRLALDARRAARTLEAAVQRLVVPLAAGLEQAQGL